MTIEADDIPISQEDAERILSDGFDNAAIDEALKRSRRGVLFIDGDAPEFRSS